MPRIFDNIEQALLPALQETLAISDRADFCVGYFNLRGWKALDQHIEAWTKEGSRCRLLIGMQKLPQDELREALSLVGDQTGVDQQTAIKRKKRLAEDLREQLAMGAPTNADEQALRRLAHQIRAGKVVVKLFLRHALHAKLYLLFRSDPINPIVGYLGSSNLTFSGLQGQGELNVDVLDHDATVKLARWFEDRWSDKFCLDISSEIAALIEESWAREQLVPPYHIYLKIAYHLSQEARDGLAEFSIPREFQEILFEYQTAAVKVAAHHLHKRGGVMIGDVVGLGKTLMATTLARIMQDDLGYSTLILCPKNLVKMWQSHVEKFGLHAKIVPFSKAEKELPHVPARFRLVLVDESHNLRNREGKRYRAIQEYIRQSESRVILLSATPYNKTYLDLSNQLRLFMDENKDTGIRPEQLLKHISEGEFEARYQCSVRTLRAFEQSHYADDWRDLMRLYLVRRTRGFIQENYADYDKSRERHYLTFDDGRRSYFPVRVPKTVTFEIKERDPNDQYARLYAPEVVTTLNGLALPRYGLGNYVAPAPDAPPTAAEAVQLENLSRAGKRLMGFCRTNLFKRLESSGGAFVQSIERHILRNYIYLHAIENGLPLPIGTQSAEVLDTRFTDSDADLLSATVEDEDAEVAQNAEGINGLDDAGLRKRAAAIYSTYEAEFKKRFKWLRSSLFVRKLAEHLRKDAEALVKVLAQCGSWRAENDGKLNALHKLLASKHGHEKVLIFTQFADTARYLSTQLKARGLKSLSDATGDSEDPTQLAWRFSPRSNEREIQKDQELRVLVATDVLSEGQNLQDAAIVVNYDLPWAIIRLIQRAGRVDRIGQQADEILCYSFLPADGVERIIQLRSRVRLRLRENAEVVGTDESFFEDDDNPQTLRDLFTEKAGILDGEPDSEVDLASQAYQIWKNATDADSTLALLIPALPPVVYATRSHQPTNARPQGALVYLKTAEGNDALAYIAEDGRSITESQFEILKIARCEPNTPALPRQERHHELVQAGIAHIVKEEKRIGGGLGRPGSARARAYERLKRHAASLKGTLFENRELDKGVDELYRYPLLDGAADTLNRQLRSGIDDERLAELVLALREDGRFCVIHEEEQRREPRVICSMGLKTNG